ncbi:hypothetical protein PPYR_04252 [Photinus pyralis]|uniref:Uncharacterized protein n=1 Tax=Photinus pyralis TaxID=7054 RepID=A0A5N4AXM1_PHOPY|nr:uncharacterized protein LOC116164884 [Photinus pyralis]KAB0802066.1 hypothetical protein PPYR_04252 [Photinus pyralis]
MKTLVVIACLCAFAVAQEDGDKKDTIFKILKDCAKKEGIDRGNIKKVIESGAFNDEKFQLFAQCFVKEIGALTSDGTVNWNYIREKCKSYTQDCAFVDECSTKTGSNQAETNASGAACLIVNIHKKMKEMKKNNKDECGEGGCPV